MNSVDIIADILHERRISAAKMCTDLGYSNGLFSQWKSGRQKPSLDKLLAVAKYLDVDINVILGNPQSPVSKIETWIDKHAYTESVELPIFGTVKAGVGGVACEEKLGTLPVMRHKLSYGCEYFWLRVNGDSMEPRFLDGDYVLVEKMCSVSSGDIAVVLIDNEEGVVKKVKYGDDWIELISDNSKYKVRRFDGEEVQRIYVIGKVISMHRDI